MKKHLNALKKVTILDSMEKGVIKDYIIFKNSDIKRWWHRFCKKGFQHCYILHFDGYEWYVLENLYWGGIFYRNITLNGYIFDQGVNIIPYYKELGYKIVEYDKIDVIKENIYNVGKLRTPLLFTPNTCVEYVKNYCGIRNILVNTPYQLYKYLLKDKRAKEK